MESLLSLYVPQEAAGRGWYNRKSNSSIRLEVIVTMVVDGTTSTLIVNQKDCFVCTIFSIHILYCIIMGVVLSTGRMLFLAIIMAMICSLYIWNNNF